MRRIVLTTCLAALALPASAQAAAAPAVPELAARVVSCQVGAAVTQRGADFEGAMPAAESASVLTMRFDLEQRRTATGAWRAVPDVPGFGRYERSAPGAAGFVYRKRVERLGLGAYRVLVRFRWLDGDGEVVRRATRRSPACRQPDLRPDPAVVGVTVGDALANGRRRYLVLVRNGGPTALLAPLRVGLAVDGVATAPATIPGLDAGAERTVAFEGPACRAGGKVKATVDPGDALAEGREGDNALTVAC